VVDLDFSGEYVVPGKTPYETYQQHIARYIFAAGLIRDKIVADVACGTGYGTLHLLTRGAKMVVGIDVSVDAINYAQKKYGEGNKLHFIRADAVHLPLPDDCADVVVSFETIEHLDDQCKFLAECKRVLKSDGLLVASTPNKRISSPCSEKPANPFHVRELYPEEFSHLLCKYFVNVTLYGQCDVNVVERGIVRVGSKILATAPAAGPVRNLLRKVIFGRNLDLSDRSSEATTQGISEQALDKRYRAHEFVNSAIKTPTYVIAVAQRQPGG
jgi:hypothetical protein